MKTLSLSVATAALMTFPMTANAQLFGNFDNNTLLSGAIGAGLGGAIGSNLAGSGQRDEGTAIGAVLGSLAGASYGNSRSRYAGNPYAGSFNPGFNGGNLLGAGIGAGLGGAIGSNLAGSGVRQEGTAIGAVLGGLAGYGIANARQNRLRSQNFGGQSYGGQGYNGGYAPAMGMPAYGSPVYGTPVYGGGYLSPQFSTPQFTGPQYVPSGQYVTSAVVPNVTYQAPRMQAPAYIGGMTTAAPNLRLAGPSLQRPDINRGLVRVETMPIARAQRTVIAAPAPIQSSRYTISEPYTMSQPYVVNTPMRSSLPIAPAARDISYKQQSAGHNSGHNYGNAVHITNPSTGSGHYHGQYTGPTYCYADSKKRYTAQGAEIIPNCNN